MIREKNEAHKNLLKKIQQDYNFEINATIYSVFDQIVSFGTICSIDESDGMCVEWNDEDTNGNKIRDKNEIKYYSIDSIELHYYKNNHAKRFMKEKENSELKKKKINDRILLNERNENAIRVARRNGFSIGEA
jgi:hypothetical protein